MSESKNNFTAAVVREKGDRSRIYIKGRPAEVLQRCSDMVVKQAKDGEFRDLALFEPGSEYYPQAVLKEPIDLTVREDIQNVVRTFGEQSLKTLAFAFRDIQVNDQQNFDWDQ
jgi:Ca2+ transporting ATPase